MSHKTKATPKDRQCGNTKPVQINRYPAGGPVKIVRPQIESEQRRQMATVTRVQKCTLTYSCSLGFLRWRRLISPSIAEMINCDVLSPGSFTFSIPSTVSCGTRALSACDFAFTLPVAISASPLTWCRPSYTKKNYIQLLTCRPLEGYLACKVVYTCKLVRLESTKTAKPRSAATLTGLLTTIDSVDNEVAMKEHNTQSQLVFLPYVSAVDPSDGEFHKMISGIEQKLLDRVKAALDEAGVAWIDTRTKERSQPAAADSVEGSDNA
ncbi:hypothetical protein GT185_000909 [Salmonella enterica]|nr:hypothetical protein [Salmonella enterica]